MTNHTGSSSRERKLKFLKEKRLSCSKCRYWILKIPGPFCSKHNFLIPGDAALTCVNFKSDKFSDDL